MKKIFTTLVIILAAVTLWAGHDPFATRRFENKKEKICMDFRVSGSDGRPQVRLSNYGKTQSYYYNYDDQKLVMLDSGNRVQETYHYVFTNGGEGLRVFRDNGRYVDLQSDNGKTASDKGWEKADSVAQSALIWGGIGAGIGGIAAHGPGAVVGGIIGGAAGAIKGILHNVFHII